MAGPYIHEAQLLQAMKRLYMLGNRKYTGGKSSGGPIESMGSSAMGLASKAAAPKPKEDPRKKVMADAIDYQTKQRTMADAIRQQTMQQAIEQAKAAQRQQKLNDAAVSSPVGGKFTNSGFEQHAGNVDRGVNDIGVSRRLMQSGMGMSGSYDPFREEF